jgi:ubiquinone/menaquinone biosynthesis C-methylase UbiE
MSDGDAAAQAFYTRWAAAYDLLADNAPGVRRVRRRAAAALSLDPGDTVVDIGCGTGANFPYLRERVGATGTVVGVDFAPGAVERARQRVEREGWHNVCALRGDATRPPVEAADAVVASFLVGMLDDPAGAVDRWLSLLDGERSGRLALVDLARTTQWPWRATNPAFRALVAASSPPGTRARHGESPTRVLDRRVAAAHRRLRGRCSEVTYATSALGFVRISAGRAEDGTDVSTR